MKYDDLLEIDDVDKQIIEILQNNPEITHSEIADKVHKSQPAVGARIIKLKRKNLLGQLVGAEFKEIDIKLARIDIAAKNVEELWERFGNCSYIVNCFKITGDYNITIEIVAPNVKTIDQFVDMCLRKDPNIINIRTNFIIDSLRRYVVPLAFDIEKYEERGCTFECGGKLSKQQVMELINSDTST